MTKLLASIANRKPILISLGLLALAAMPLALRPRVAQADERAPFKAAFTVQAELITTTEGCQPGDLECTQCVNKSSVYVEAWGIGDTSLGRMFMEVLKCYNPVGGPFGTYAGTFKMMTDPANPGKDSVTGTYAGQNDNAGDFYQWQPFSGVLTITGGTGKFDGVQGSASFTATAGPAAPLTPGTSGATTNMMVMAFYSVQGTLG